MINTNTTRLLLLITCFLLTLSSCGNKKKNAPINDWNKLKSWSFKGKMAINDGSNNGSGRVKWLVSNNSIQAQFKAPLGQGSWTITENKNNAKLVSTINGESNAEFAQELISYELGWHFPWDSLQFWLRGHQNNETIQKINQPKTTFTDEGWQITYTKWTQTPLGLLPKKIKASKPPYSVKLIIYSWDFE